MSSDALEQLSGYAWPGNVREIENVNGRQSAPGGGPCLGINRNTLRKKLRPFGIKVGDEAPRLRPILGRFFRRACRASW